MRQVSCLSPCVLNWSKTEVDIITGKERLVGHVYATLFRRPDTYSKLHRKLAYLITKDNYWKETPCGPEAQYYEAMR